MCRKMYYKCGNIYDIIFSKIIVLYLFCTIIKMLFSKEILKCYGKFEYHIWRTSR